MRIHLEEVPANGRNPFATFQNFFFKQYYLINDSCIHKISERGIPIVTSCKLGSAPNWPSTLTAMMFPVGS